MDNKKSLKLLNKLIANHNDRIVCYEMGITQTTEPALKTMLTHFVQVSKKCKDDLSNEISRSNNVPADNAREESKFMVAWADVKKALEKKEIDGILEGCEKCEQAIANVYEDILSKHQNELSSEEQLTMIKSQQNLLRENLKEVSETKDTVAPHH